MPASEFGSTTIIAAALGAISTAITWVAGRRGSKADYADRLLDATIPAAEMLAKRLAAVEQKVSDAEAEVADCEQRFRLLNAKHDHLVQWLGTLDLKLPPLPEDI